MHKNSFEIVINDKESEYWGSFMNNLYPFCNENCYHAGLWGIQYDYRKYGVLPG